MWICKNCNAPNLDSNVACDSCGKQRMVSSEQKDFWPKAPYSSDSSPKDARYSGQESGEEDDFEGIVDRFIQQKKSEQKAIFEQEKREKLISLGLYKQVFDEANTGDRNEFPFELKSYSTGPMSTVRYKKVVPDIEDETYNELVEIIRDDTVKIDTKIADESYEVAYETADSPNNISLMLKWIAYLVYFGGFILGIMLGKDTYTSGYRTYTEFSFALALVYWVAAFVSGTLMLGLSEIISLLAHLDERKYSIKRTKGK